MGALRSSLTPRIVAAKYDIEKGIILVETRKFITISLPLRLFKEVERLAERENRTKSELLREALRLYVETSEVRREAIRERLFALIDRVQARTQGVPARHIRKVVRDAVAAARSPRVRAIK